MESEDAALPRRAVGARDGLRDGGECRAAGRRNPAARVLTTRVLQSIMERFPAAWVHQPTAFTSPEPAELYNNVLAFVVGPPGGAGGSPEPPPRRELHIFQCHDVAAQALVEELNALK